jgi:hypothetical protein
MPRKKRGSIILEKAERRAVALESIHTELDLGSNLTLQLYTTQIDGLRDHLDEYNKLLSNLDRVSNEIIEKERSLRDLSELMLMGVATRYGKSSNEYEMAGGIRKVDRKRPVRSKTAAAV